MQRSRRPARIHPGAGGRGGHAAADGTLLKPVPGEGFYQQQPVVELTGPDFLCELTPLPCTVMWRIAGS